MSGPTGQPQQLAPEAFLSHCSAQRDFVLYLGARLKAHALQFFSSSELDHGCKPGRPFDESLLQHVRGAGVVVLVLSQQYFGSKWCLRELVEALQVQQGHRPEKVLLPVFYGWQRPEQLGGWLQMQEQQGLQDSCLKWTGQPLRQLWDSLSSMQGLVFPPGSSNPQLADEVLGAVRRHIHCPGFSEQQFVGATPWVDWAIDHLLQQDGQLGIWGMGGSGKTTLTMLLFNRLREQFSGRVARVEVGEQPSQEHLMKLQHHILTTVCEADTDFSAPSAGAEALKQSLLAMPNFLIILDDLWEDPARPNMLQWLLPPEVAKACSSKGSWVVVATRHSSIVTTLLGLATARELPKLDEGGEWEVVQLNADSALEGWPTPDRKVLLQAGNHLPLKLQLLGRQLKVAGPHCYQDVLQGIKDHGKLPAEVTQHLDAAFITSYRALPSEHKLPFLDIAMFMRGAPKQDVMDWCNAIHGDPVHGRMTDDVVRALERRALVTWAGGMDDPVGVHDELKDFVLRYVQPLATVPERRPEDVAFFWEKQQVCWPSGSSSLAPKRVVAIGCQDPAVLVRSIPGNPGPPVRPQPKMDSLEVLVLRYKYTWECPVEQLLLQDLDNLKFLDIRECGLTQLHLGELPSLAGLLMSFERLREWREWGECLRALPKLQYLQAASCGLTGPLPSSLSERLQHLDLQHNSLQGQLPTSLSALTSLTYLNLSGDRSYRAREQLEQWEIASNELQGTLPPEWSNLKRLRALDLEANSIGGRLPPEWSGLTALQVLNLKHNRLCGMLPNSWSKLVGLQELHLTDNFLSGWLPRDWSELCSLTDLQLDKNKLQGKLPPAWSTLGKLDRLLLDSNSLCGPLPSSWAELTQLRWLNVSYCGLQGRVPEQWSRLQQLEVFDLRDNCLTGPIPKWVRQRVDMQQLSVELINNDFESDEWLEHPEEIECLDEYLPDPPSS